MKHSIGANSGMGWAEPTREKIAGAASMSGHPRKSESDFVFIYHML